MIYQPFGSSTIIIDNYELNEYEFRQLQLDYAKGIEVKGHTLKEIVWTVYLESTDEECTMIPITGEFNSDGSLTRSMPSGYLDISDNIALELFRLKYSIMRKKLD